MFATESYRNCLETERLLMKDIRNAELPARDRATCANALDRILERKRILKMKPKVRDVDFKDLPQLTKRAKARADDDENPFTLAKQEPVEAAVDN